MTSLVIGGVEEIDFFVGLCQDDLAVLSIEHPNAAEGDGRAPRFAAPILQEILCFWDTEQRHRHAPHMHDVKRGLDFLSVHRHKRQIAIHCAAGISRSTAFAYVELIARHGPGREHLAVTELLALRPIAAPNRRIIRLAELLLDRPKNSLMGPLESHPQIRDNWVKADRQRADWVQKNMEIARRERLVAENSR